MGMIRFPCPSCQRVLRVGDQFVGRQAKCPGCATSVTVPATSVEDPAEAAYSQAPAPAPRQAAPPPPPPPSGDPFAFSDSGGAVAQRGAGRTDDGYAPPDYGRGSFAAGSEAELGGWKSTRSALRLLSISVTIKLISFIALIVTYVLMFLAMGAFFLSLMDTTGLRRSSSIGGGGAEAGVGLMFLMIGVIILIFLAVFAARILDLIGTIFLLQIPEAVGAKGLALTAMICQCVVLGSPLIYCAGVGAQSPGIMVLFNVFAYGGMLVSTIMILIILHKVGRHLQSDALCKQVVRYAIWWGVGTGVMVLTICGGAFVIGFTAASAVSSRSSGASVGYAMIAMIALMFLVSVTVVVVLYIMLNQLYGLASRVIQRKAVNPEY